jgi:hypothetical protein
MEKAGVLLFERGRRAVRHVGATADAHVVCTCTYSSLYEYVCIVYIFVIMSVLLVERGKRAVVLVRATEDAYVVCLIYLCMYV